MSSCCINPPATCSGSIPLLCVGCVSADCVHAVTIRLLERMFTCFNNVAQLIEQEFVVSSSVQALLYVAVQFIHHALHIRVLVLLDTRHTEIATPQPRIITGIGFQNSVS